MSLAGIDTRASVGIRAPEVRVEVHLSGGLPQLSIVGLPETAVKESRDRVRAALLNAGFEFPARRVTISLAPADLPKEGGRFDLPIALGILAASGQVPREALENTEFLGELALDGTVRPIRGCLPAVLAARDAGRKLILPAGNGAEAGLVVDADCRLALTLSGLCAALQGHDDLPEPPHTEPAPVAPDLDLADVRGQLRARRALEIAAAGGHNLLLLGPPGTGKSMLAARLPGILPPMSDAEALETAAVASVAGRAIDPATWRQRPFRSPHHTASGVALVGGGGKPRPGEISLCHGGVLFLDELPEFSRQVLEVLREPLESGRIVISRAALQAEFPADFQLVTAMNPCPCGYHGDPSGRCRCSPDQVQRYRQRISGPLLDRIDLHIDVPRQKPSGHPPGEDSAAVAARVLAARQRQLDRTGGCNARLTPSEIDRHCRLTDTDRHLLDTAAEKLQLSARGHHRVLRLARTLADLEGAERIATEHLTEAIGLRQLDRAAPATA